MTRRQTQECLDMSLKELLTFIKTLPNYFEDYDTSLRQKSVNSKYFKKIQDDKCRYVFDTNVFIDHQVMPTDIPIKMSATVMFEIIKKKLFITAYRRFFEFHFSSTDVKFPAKSFHSLNPKYFDENIIKELEKDDILVTADRNLRERVKRSMSYIEFNKKVRTPFVSGIVSLSPNASMFFSGKFNWSLQPPKMIDYRFNFTPVINEEFSNEIITFNTPYSTPIVLPEPLETEYSIPEFSHDPLVDISGISKYDSSFIDDIEYNFPYTETKTSDIKIEDYETSIMSTKKSKKTDEIFPITTEKSLDPHDFARHAGYMSLDRIRKRSTNLFRNNNNLRHIFEKEENKNKEMTCVKDSERVDNFISYHSKLVNNMFNDFDYTLITAPNVSGPFDTDLKEVKIPSSIRSIKLLSKLYEDLVYQCSVKMRENEIIIRTNGLPFGFILYPGNNKKSIKTIRTYRLFFEKDCRGVWDPEIDFGDYSVSRCYTESLEDIKFKSVLFDNLLPIYLRDLMSPSEFIEFYYHIFWANSASKSQLGFLKFYTVISESKFSNLENLVKKYLYHPYKREIHFRFQKKMFDMIKKNLEGSFNSIFSKSKDIFDFIDSNSIFVYNKKLGQNSFHSYKQFVSDIENNCNSFQEKFTGIFKMNEKKMKGKFVSIPVMKESFRIFKKKLEKRNINSENILEDFKRYFIEDFGVFKSSSGSLDIHDSMKKKKCIETYLSELEHQGVFVDEFEFVFNCLINKKDESVMTGLTKKPQAEGSNREIYVTNVQKRSQLYVIQTFFKVLCKFCDVDMVVESQFKKFEMIQESSESDSKKTFLNADMGKWSPQDTKEKFDWCLELLISLDIVPSELIGLLRKCMSEAKEFLIIIPDNFKETDFYKEFKDNSKRSFQKKKVGKNEYETMSFDFGWPQGMFHNISSFIHSCSCFLTDNLLKERIPDIISNKFFVSSDDKNLVTTFSRKPNKYDMRLVMEITDKVSNAFSLESSSTKNSISDLLTEMISVINYKGTIIYSPMKSLANMDTSLDDQCFIKNHKSILSRICTFFGMSNRLKMSELLYEYYSSRLCEHYKVRKDYKAPICAFGLKSCSILEYHRAGEHFDNMAKYFSNPQQTYNYIINARDMKMIEITRSKRITDLLSKKRGLIDHYRYQSSKRSFDIDLNFILGLEYDSIESGKKRMFLEKSDFSFNSYYYKASKANYKVKEEKLSAPEASAALSRPCGKPHQCDNFVYRSRSVAKIFFDYRNLLSVVHKQYEPEGKIHYMKERAYESINNSFNELLLMVKNPEGVTKNPKYSRKTMSMIKDIRNVCKSLKISTIEEFERSRSDFEELKERSKSNTYFRFQHRGEFETLDYKFETRRCDLINPGNVVETKMFVFEPFQDSKLYKNNFRQLFNTLVFDVKVNKMGLETALKKLNFSYKEMIKGFKIDQINSMVMSMSDIFQLYNMYHNPDSNFKFKSKGTRRLEWDSITDRISAVRIKEGLKDMYIAVVDEHDKVLVFEKDIPSSYKKIMRVDNTEFVIDSQLYKDLVKGYENFFRLNEEAISISQIEVRSDKKVFLEFTGPNFRTKKLVPISNVKKDQITVPYVSIDKFLITVKKVGNNLVVKGNSIPGEDEVTLDFNLKQDVPIKDVKEYASLLSNELQCDAFICNHKRECIWDKIPSKENDMVGFYNKNHKYVKICSKTLHWQYFNGNEMIRELSEVKDNIIKEVEEKDEYQFVELLEQFLCSKKQYINGEDFYNALKGNLTFKDSMIIEKALRKGQLTSKFTKKGFYYDTENESVTYVDLDNDIENVLKPKKDFAVRYYDYEDQDKLLLEQLKSFNSEMIKEIEQKFKLYNFDKYQQFRNKYYEFLDLEKKASQQSKPDNKDKSAFMPEFIDDITSHEFIREASDEVFEEDDIEKYNNMKKSCISADELFEMINKMDDDEEEDEKTTMMCIFESETKKYDSKTYHDDECDEDPCDCLFEEFEKLENEHGIEKAISIFKTKGFKYETYLDSRFYEDALEGEKKDEIKVSCQCVTDEEGNKIFDCLHWMINESDTDPYKTMNSIREDTFKDIIKFQSDIEDEYKETKIAKLYYNDQYIFIPRIEANYREAKRINMDLYIDNQEAVILEAVNLSDLFKDIKIAMKDLMEEEEADEKVLDEVMKDSQETFDDVHESQFNFFKKVKKPERKNESSSKKKSFDDVTEEVLKSSPETVCDSIRIYGTISKTYFERRKQTGKFNTMSETMITGFRTSSSEIFDERRKFDDLTLDCSRETILQAYVCYVWIYKKLTQISDKKFEKVRRKILGLKNSLNVYLIANKNVANLSDDKALFYTMENVDKDSSSNNSSFLKSLMGDTIVHKSTVRNIFSKLNRLEDFDILNFD